MAVDLTHLAKLIEYDPRTGALVWAEGAGPHRPAGDDATHIDREGRITVIGHDAGPIAFYLMSGVWADVQRIDWNRGLTLSNLQVMGVEACPKGFRASVTVLDRRYDVGVYPTLQEAVEARKAVLKG